LLVGCNLLNMAKPNSDQASLKQPRGEKFVRTVLEIALLQLAEVGFERLSIPDIAVLAEVNKTSIYRRWPTKEELVHEALKVAMSHADESPNTGALRSDLIKLAQTIAVFIQSPVGKAIVRIMHSEGANSELRALAQKAYGESSGRGPFVVVKRAMERGEIKIGSDPSLMLFTIAGAVMHRVFVEQSEVTEALLEQVVDMVLFGAAAKPPPSGTS
jgi:AcrR family transcriptional regulator